MASSRSHPERRAAESKDPSESSDIPRGPLTPLRFARDDKKSYLGCNAMLEPTQVFSLLKLTPIILPWLIRTRLFTRIGAASFSGQTNIIRISAFDFGPSGVGTNSAY